MTGRSLSERSIEQLADLTRGWSVQDLGQLSVRVSQIRAETKHTPSVASLIKVGTYIHSADTGLRWGTESDLEGGGGADSGESKPPNPKFRFLLGFRPHYFGHIGRAKCFGKYSKQSLKSRFLGDIPRILNRGRSPPPPGDDALAECYVLHDELIYV